LPLKTICQRAFSLEKNYYLWEVLWQEAAGSRQPAAGRRQPAAGSRQQAAGSRQQAEVGGQGENPNTQIPNPKQIQNSNFPIFKTVMFGFNIVFEF
jgi:hypothetical protein